MSELRAAKPDLNIEIIGVNRNTDAAYNSEVTSVSTLAWLQDTTENSVWNQWEIAYRDVVIVDSQNRFFAVFNLTVNDLFYPENQQALKQLFLAAAKVVDSDGDRLPDDWENRHFGNLAADPGSDADGDGRDNFREFAFGTNPSDGKSLLTALPSLTVEGQRTVLSLTFRRQAGSYLDYVVEASTDLAHWSKSTADVVVKKPPRNLFDGTGTSEVTYALTKPVSAGQMGFIRVRAVPRAGQ